MTAAYTEFANSRAQTLGSTDCFGTNTSLPSVPFYYNEVTMYIADYSTNSCYCSNSAAQSGLVLAANYPDNNLSRYEQVILTFTNPVCAPVTFSIWDINQALFGSSSYFTDVVEISATDATATAIPSANITIGSCGTNTVATLGNAKVITAVGTGCTCGSHAVSIGGSQIKTITITYKNGGATYSSNPSSQYIIITNIVASAAPTASITAAPLACGSNTTTLTAVTNASSPTYAWSGTAGTSITSPSSSSTTVTGAGTYTLTVNPGGCSRTATYTLTPSGTPPNVSIATPSVLTCSSSSVVLTASSSTSGVTYTWSGGGTGATKSVSAAGTYTVTASSAGCSATASATVSQNTVTPNVSIAPPATLTCINTPVTLTASSTTSGATFAWSGGGTGATKSVSTSANYTITATDPSNGCKASTSVFVPKNITLPNVSINPPAALTCASPNITLTATSSTSGATFAWSGGGTGNTKPVSVAGSYSVTASDPGNGCTASASTTVALSNTLPKTNASIVQPSCLGSTGSITLNPSGGTSPYSYTWSANAASGNIASASNLAVGIYTVTISTGDGCQKDTSITLTAPNSPDISAVNFSSPTCTAPSGGIISSVTVTGGTGTLQYGYAPSSNPTAVTPIASFPLSNITPGTYILGVQDVNSCRDTFWFTINPLPNPLTINSIGVAQLACYETTGTISNVNATGGTSPYLYSYAPLSNPSASVNIAAFPLSGIAIGNYVLTVSDANNCTDTSWFSITKIDLFLNPVQASPENCIGASNGVINNAVPFYGTAPYSFSYASSSTPSATIPFSAFPVNGVSPDTYIMYVSDANGCSDTAWFTIAPGLSSCCSHSISAVITQPTCLANGSIDVSVTGGLGNFNFVWSQGGATTEDVLNLTAGTYYVTVTDDITLCSKDTFFTLAVPATPDVDAGQPKVLTCVITNVTLDGSSITPNISYSWSNGLGSNATAVASIPGTYTLTVTDNTNGCSASNQVVVTLDNTPPNLSVQTPADITCVNPIVTITATSTTSGVNYNWSAGSNTSTQDVSIAGAYIVIVTDNNNGCTASQSVNVAEQPTIDFTINNTQATCGNANGTTTINIINGNGPYLYEWNTGATTIDIVNLSGGQYNATVTDINGCKNSKSTTLGYTPKAVKPFIGEDKTICNGDVVELNAGNSYTLYRWQDGTTTSVYSAISAGIYIITVTDNNGCESMDTVQISLRDDCDFKLVMPTAFSPNGDGANETYKPVYVGIPTSFEMRIFNRWGEKVYETTDIDFGWNGRYKGVDQTMETYVWTVGYTYGPSGIKKNLMGNLTLLR